MSTAVLIGKFQAPIVSGRTASVLKEIMLNHDHLLVLMHQPKQIFSKNFPLSYSLRSRMLKAYLDKGLTLSYKIVPLFQDEYESLLFKNINQEIKIYTNDPVTIYIGDDETWFERYPGPHPYVPVSFRAQSNETIRNLVVKERDDQGGSNQVLFRAGFMYANITKPQTYMPKICVVFTDQDSNILLIKREKESHFILPKSFLTSTDNSLESCVRSFCKFLFPDAYVTNLAFVTSIIEEDWYTKGSGDKTVTIVFTAKVRGELNRCSADIQVLKKVPQIMADIISANIYEDDLRILRTYINSFYIPSLANAYSKY